MEQLRLPWQSRPRTYLIKWCTNWRLGMAALLSLKPVTCAESICLSFRKAARVKWSALPQMLTQSFALCWGNWVISTPTFLSLSNLKKSASCSQVKPVPASPLVWSQRRWEQEGGWYWKFYLTLQPSKQAYRLETCCSRSTASLWTVMLVVRLSCGLVEERQRPLR